MSSTQRNTRVAIWLSTINNENCNRKPDSKITIVRLKTEQPTLDQRTDQCSTKSSRVRLIIGVLLFKLERKQTLLNIINILQNMYSMIGYKTVQIHHKRKKIFFLDFS